MHGKQSMFLMAALLAVTTPLVTAQDTGAHERRDRPNILWIIAEDLGPELACYGTKEVGTPNLDRLAGEGVRYTKAFTVNPVCSSSRSSFMTGMHAQSIGAQNHRSHRRDGYRLPKGVRLLTHRLRDAGYFTANIRRGIPGARGTGKTDWNFTVDKPYDSSRYEDLAANQPFYAQINFPETHRGSAWNNSHKVIAKPADPAKVVFPPYYPDHPVVRKDWAQYLNTVMALDLEVGRVLAQLRKDGLLEKTVVMFFGDHGRAMVRAKQWPYDSGLHVPLLIRWPKDFKAPRQLRAGKVDDRLIASIDLTATTLAIAGVEKPDGMQGRVFLGDTADPDRRYCFAGRDRCDETVFRIRTVRDERFRYIKNFMPDRPFLQRNRYKERQYPVIAVMRELYAAGKLDPVQAVLMAPRRPAEELYDLDNDPYEIKNLAKDPTYSATLERLRTVLADWIESSGDQGRTPEPKEIVDYWEKRAAANDARRKRKR